MEQEEYGPPTLKYYHFPYYSYPSRCFRNGVVHWNLYLVRTICNTNNIKIRFTLKLIGCWSNYIFCIPTKLFDVDMTTSDMYMQFNID
jgi:hypothetical protein